MKRRVGFLLIVSAAVPLVVVATAWACGVLATLRLDKTVAAPNQSLTASGVNYGQVTAGNSPVQLRWNSRTGPVLREVTPDGKGNIDTTVDVPANTKPGWYVLMATQYKVVDGTPKAGTPGRTTLRVQGAGKSSSAPVAPWSSSKPTGPGGAGAPVAVHGGSGSPASLPALLGVLLSLALLGTGVTLVARGRVRTANRPLHGV
jgi:hypothetical protein